MTPREFASIRRALGLTSWEFGRALGYAGDRNTVQVCVRRYEKGDREIAPWIARLAYMYKRHGVPEEFLS